MKNERLQSELDDLRERYDITLDQLTADEIATFVDCCRRIDNPYSDVNAEIIGTPVTVRGVKFYPLTIGASVWLDEFAGKWWKDDRRYFYAMAYAMANANDPGAFEAVQTEGEAIKRITAMAIRLAFAKGALKKAMDRCLGIIPDVPTESVKEQAATDWSAIVARLEGQSGIRREEWVWGRTARYSIKAYCDLRRFASETGMGGQVKRAKDELDDAINALARLKKSIKDRLEAQDE